VRKEIKAETYIVKRMKGREGLCMSQRWLMYIIDGSKVGYVD
jgi:hypothetical protein